MHSELVGFFSGRYASAVYAVALCPCLCPSVTGRSSIETAQRIELGIGKAAASFHVPPSCTDTAEITASTKIRLFAFGTSCPELWWWYKRLEMKDEPVSLSSHQRRTRWPCTTQCAATSSVKTPGNHDDQCSRRRSSCLRHAA